MDTKECISIKVKDDDIEQPHPNPQDPTMTPSQQVRVGPDRLLLRNSNNTHAYRDFFIFYRDEHGGNTENVRL